MMSNELSQKAKKKLAVVAVFFPPQSVGGGTRVVADNVDHLIDQYSHEFELVIFTTDFSQQEPHSVYLYSYRGVRVYRVGILWREHMDWHPKDAAMGEVFSQFLKHEQPDLVHFHSVQRMSASVVESTVDLGIPFVVTVHDAWWISDFQFLVDEAGTVYPSAHPDPFNKFEPPSGISFEDSLARRSYLKGLLNQAERVLAVSEAFGKIYTENGVHKVQTNSNGISKTEWKPRTPSPTGRVRLGHVGGMAVHKGYPIFKSALVKGSYRNIEAVVVDLGAPYGHTSTDQWGTVPVSIIGKTPQSQIEQLYAEIDVLVAPSIWPESFGLVTREASAAGLWVLASNLGGIGEDVLEGITGNVFEPSEKALLELFSKIDLDHGKYLNSVPSSTVRTVDQQVAELVDVYRRILMD